LKLADPPSHRGVEIWHSPSPSGRPRPALCVRTGQGQPGPDAQPHPRGQAARWLKEWAKPLEGPLEDVLATLTSRPRGHAGSGRTPRSPGCSTRWSGPRCRKASRCGRRRSRQRL